jgi:predicted HicB family RNase H-like nuclease
MQVVEERRVNPHTIRVQDPSWEGASRAAAREGISASLWIERLIESELKKLARAQARRSA